MNWLLFATIIFLILNMAWGYSRGFLRVLYSLGRWILVLAMVIILTPYVSAFLINHTPLYNHLEQKIATRIEMRAEEKIGESVDEQENDLEELGMKIPHVIEEKIPQLLEKTEEQIEETGVYDAIAAEMATLAIKGIAIIVVIIFAILICLILMRFVKKVEKVPVISDINHWLGVAAGFVKGMLIVWILLAVLAAEVGTEAGQFLIPYIYEAPLLNWLYENNLVLSLIFII